MGPRAAFIRRHLFVDAEDYDSWRAMRNDMDGSGVGGKGRAAASAAKADVG